MPKKNGYFTERKIKNAVGPSSKPIALGNIFEVFSQLENLALILSGFLPQMERLIELMEISSQISPPQVPDNSSVNLQGKLTELLSIAKETRELQFL